MRLLIIDTFYVPYLEKLYSRKNLKEKKWKVQHESHFSEGFGTGDSYSYGLGLLGIEAIEIVANNPIAQRQWAIENEPELIKNELNNKTLLAILEAQIKWWKPTIIYIQDINWIPSSFLKNIKKNVQLIVGQCACPIKNNLDLKPYDLICTAVPHYVQMFRDKGVESEYLPIGFDSRLAEKFMSKGSNIYPLTFIGGLGGHHSKGTELLEAIAAEVPLNVWGYGAERLEQGSKLKEKWRGEAWAGDMYKILSQSKITINRHIDISGIFACNMRLYEATGMGACLITDKKTNLSNIFKEDEEVVTYETDSEAIFKIKQLIKYPIEAEKIAKRGHMKTMSCHTYEIHMQRLADILINKLASKGVKTCRTLENKNHKKDKRYKIPIAVRQQDLGIAKFLCEKNMITKKENEDYVFITDKIIKNENIEIWSPLNNEFNTLLMQSFLNCIDHQGYIIELTKKEDQRSMFSIICNQAADKQGIIIKKMEIN